MWCLLTCSGLLLLYLALHLASQSSLTVGRQRLKTWLMDKATVQASKQYDHLIHIDKLLLVSVSRQEA